MGGHRRAAFEVPDVEKMQAMIELNVTALTRLTYAAAPAFVARGGGTIINISSAVAIAPELLNGVYGATKHLCSLSACRSTTDWPKTVRIQTVLPGAVATNFSMVAGGSLGDLPGKMVMQSDDLVDAALAGLDQGELVTIPSLPDAADWHAYEAARQKLFITKPVSQRLAGTIPNGRRGCVNRARPLGKILGRWRPISRTRAGHYMDTDAISRKDDQRRRLLVGAAAVAACAINFTGTAHAENTAGLTTPTKASPQPGVPTSFGPLKQIHAGVLDIGYAGNSWRRLGRQSSMLHGWPYDIHTYVNIAPLLAAEGFQVIITYIARLRHHALPRQRHATQCTAGSGRC